MENTYTPEEAFEFAKAKESRFKLIHEMSCADLKTLVPDLNIYGDGSQYYDPGRNEIHLGTGGACEMFRVQSDEDLYQALLFLRGHEEQHRRCTASKPYARAIERGAKAVVDYVAEMIEGKPVRLKNDRQYADYCMIELPAKGIHISLDRIFEVARFITNSLEDGRIERIRASRFPGFEAQRVLFRGRSWENMQDDGIDPLSMTAVDRLHVLMNQVLSLATCQLYSKGFVKKYAGTGLIEETRALMPYIGKAVLGSRTKDLEVQVIGIMREMSPSIFEAVQLSEKDVKAKEAFESMIADMIRSMVDRMPEGELSERDEEEGAESAGSVFPHSDLVVTIDDETYDKLMEKAKKGKGSGGIMVRREHPKEESSDETPESKEGGENSGEGKDASTESGEGSPKGSGRKEKSAGGISGETPVDSSPATEAGPENKGESCEPDGEDACSNTGSPAENPEAAENTGRETAVGTSGANQGMKPESIEKGHASKEGSTAGTPDPEKAIKGILDSIHKAEDMLREEAASKIASINEAEGHAKKTVEGTEVKDTEKPFSQEEASGVMGDGKYGFCEVLRDYEPTDDLPPVILARGKALHRRNEKYFRSLSSPSIRNLASGGVDPARLYGLAIGDTDIFRKRGKDKHFDGCAYILLDNSGSMSHGAKFREACTAAAVIEEGFKGLIPLKIASFSDDYSTVIHQRMKGWDEKLRKNCVWNYYTHKSPHGGNADGCSIGVAVKELLKRPERRKLLVVLSDGQPTEGSANPVELTKQKVAYARKKGIKVIGIYFENGRIGYDADVFRSIYGAGADGICCTTAEIDRNLGAVFEKFARG